MLYIIYENIAYCICKKKKRLFTSQTCYGPKLEMGAKILPLHTYIHFTNPIAHKLFGRILINNLKCYSELVSTDKPSEVLAKYDLCFY